MAKTGAGVDASPELLMHLCLLYNSCACVFRWRQMVVLVSCCLFLSMKCYLYFSINISLWFFNQYLLYIFVESIFFPIFGTEWSVLNLVIYSSTNVLNVINYCVTSPYLCTRCISPLSIFLSIHGLYGEYQSCIQFIKGAAFHRLSAHSL